MKAIILALTVLFSATAADAACWKASGQYACRTATNIFILDYTGMAVVDEAAERWDEATVTTLEVRPGDPGAAVAQGGCRKIGCAPTHGLLSVVFADLGPRAPWGRTRVSYDEYGFINGATISVNTSRGDPAERFSDDWNRYWMLDLIGRAVGEVLDHAPCTDIWGPVPYDQYPYPQYPDDCAIDAMNAAYGQ